MKPQTGGKKFFGKAMLAAAAFVGLLAFAGTPSARADEYARCQRRIAKADHRLHEAVEHHGWDSRQADKADHRLHEAVEHHGWDSRQADHARHELHEARERCWNERHRWWDEDGRRWHTDRDWDDHDHDRH